MQVGESISPLEVAAVEKEECLFEHREREKVKNKLSGSSRKLGDQLGQGKSTRLWSYSGDNKVIAEQVTSESLKRVRPSITSIRVRKDDGGTEEHSFQWDAHHLIPTSSTYHDSKNKLKPFVEGGETIADDIGYDINGAENGIWLPRIGPAAAEASRSVMSTWSRQTHQWDSSHSGYSDFVVQVLEKVVVSLTKDPEACGDCKKNSQGKANPPHRLVMRLNQISQRLGRLLRGSASSWRPPVFVSKYAQQYNESLRGPSTT